jgi:hypothetical protein
MRINNEKLLSDTGLQFESSQDAINYLQSLLYYLITHNKNYTIKQYQFILDINYIIDAMEVDRDEI